MPRFQRKRSIVDAMQVPEIDDEEAIKELTEFLEMFSEVGETPREHGWEILPSSGVEIRTNLGLVKATPGDWIVRDEKHNLSVESDIDMLHNYDRTRSDGYHDPL